MSIETIVLQMKKWSSVLVQHQRRMTLAKFAEGRNYDNVKRTEEWKGGRG